MNRIRAGRNGFSLVEFLIALVLGLLVSLAAIGLFISSKRSYRLQEARSKLQDNARYSLAVLSHAIRMSDFWGGVLLDNVQLIGPASYGGSGGCKDAWLINTRNGLQGFSGSVRKPIGMPDGCLDHYIPQSDALLVRYADPDSVVSTAELGRRLDGGRYFVRAALGQSARLFDSALSGPRQQAISELPDRVDAPGVVRNFRFKPELYYLAHFRGADGSTSPSLYYKRATENASIATPITEGIEMLHFEFGEDRDADGNVDSYRTANQISDAEWPRVMSVRIMLIVRGEERDFGKDQPQYALGNGGFYIPAAAEQSYIRQQFIKEVSLRNHKAPTP